MGGGNGAKAAQKRARNAKDAPKEAKSQLKTNAAAMSIICKTCRQTFLSTSRRPQLDLHVQNKHEGKASFATCFPDFKE